ncbi:MAG: FadR family transcriptional regulator [Lachnospiraceae bacterium]|nr:FadR family transcriptional regulator [Lachnospiraceae bacterium]
MKAIHRVSITDAVVENIKESIETGEYGVGTKLPTEASLCEEMKVSRTSIREAIRVLQALGYITIKPGKGAFVSEQALLPKNVKPWYEAEGAEYSDFMEVRFVLETLAVRLAVERATSSQVRELEEVHHSFCEVSKKRDMTKLIILDETFHTKIMSYTGNPLLTSINRQLLDSFRKYRGESFTNEQVYSNAVEPHGRILECFKCRDAEGAVREMERHLEITHQDMIHIHNIKKK